MPKYMVAASYTAEGLKGLQKDKASGRRSAVNKVVEGLGGKVEAMYFALGDQDVMVIVDYAVVGSSYRVEACFALVRRGSRDRKAGRLSQW